MDPDLAIEDWAGLEVEVVIDRPLGSRHPREPEILYEVNYGYVPGTSAPDGHPIDVYVLGTDEPLERCRARIVAIVRRRDDVEDKLVAAIAGRWDADAIVRAIEFQERYFDTWVELPDARRGVP